MSLVDAANLATFGWLTWWVSYAVRTLWHRREQCIWFVYLVFYVFCGLPLLLDVVVGRPDYFDQPMFAVATNDVETCLIYCVYVSLVPLLWHWLGTPPGKLPTSRKSELAADRTRVTTSSGFRNALWLMLAGPALLLPLAPSPALYSHYAVSLGNTLSANEAEFHTWMTLAANFAVLGASGLLLTERRIRMQSIMTIAPFLLLAMWLHGKRNIIALTMFSFGYVLWKKGYLVGLRLVIAIALGVSGLSLANYFYQNSVRIQFDLEGTYTHLRIDYGRDDVIKMAIYAELHPKEIKVLEYRGQSLAAVLTAPIPRSLWAEKPWPYAVYVTAAMLAWPEIEYLGWCMTTSILDEAIANFSWLGMAIGPVIVAVVCRVGESSGNPLCSTLTVLVAALLLVLQLMAFLPLFVLWCWVLIWSRNQGRIAVAGKLHLGPPAKRLRPPEYKSGGRASCATTHSMKAS